ncbi:cytosolic Fe-S cluster assembly factor NUBP2 homolog [Rhopalosiphum maidis]|uniref:cytosolic Fe-S cluster assembly factor NUBP2 homolog n=1 Tax=Rhopalosiphum maidis TaxID=43146 RepID=UPI000EFF6E44|nr:cytosolic Fe-S cluster assembly factor NUBP2 homolog [Rhopalosiphum maidis]
MASNVKHIILVMSGKGGVGKSTVSTQLALGLVAKGYRVGILDVDLCGPSIPYLLKLENQEVHQCEAGWVPVYTDESKSLGVLSIGFLTKSRNDSVVWRGPKKTAFIKQLLSDVFWEDVDYLIIDTPPGTSDEHITVMENIKETPCDGAILVTTPQQIALDDVRKELSFCRKTSIPILGIVENMSGYVCPNCAECTNLFSSNGGKSLAEHFQVPFLGTVPIDPRVSSETSKYVGLTHPESQMAISYNSIVDRVINPN